MIVDDLKDLLHDRLTSRARTDAETGCLIYPMPTLYVRSAQAPLPVAKIAAWIYRGIPLVGATRIVTVRSTCKPCCFNPDHLIILAAAKASKVVKRKLTGQTATEIKLEGRTMSVTAVADLHEITWRAVVRILNGETWGDL